jgi:hypothetical protein
MHAADLARPGRSPRMAQGADAPWRERVVPQRAWGAAQCRQRPVASGQVRTRRLREMSIVGVQAGIAARAEALCTLPDYVYHAQHPP